MNEGNDKAYGNKCVRVKNEIVKAQQRTAFIWNWHRKMSSWHFFFSLRNFTHGYGPPRPNQSAALATLSLLIVTETIRQWSRGISSCYSFISSRYIWVLWFRAPLTWTTRAAGATYHPTAGQHSRTLHHYKFRLVCTCAANMVHGGRCAVICKRGAFLGHISHG